MSSLFKILVISFCVTSVFGCASYSIPQAGEDVVLNLTYDDVIIQTDATGKEWAFSPFPFNFIANTSQRAITYAVGSAAKNAYETGESDFVLKPRSKVKYFNFIVFDFAEAEVIGKAVKIK